LERAIILLAIPMVLEMCMESLFGVVDVFWVARLGEEATAAVGVTESCITVIFALAMGLSMAATAMVARRTGEKQPKEAATVAVQAIAIGVLMSSITGVLGYLYAPNLLRAMGAKEAVITTGAGYTRTILAGSVTIFLIFLINAVFRGVGDAATAMRTLWLANAINICLNPCLIFGLGPFPKLGIEGSAVGTTVGRGIGVLYQLWILQSSRSRLRIERDDLRLHLDVMLRLLRLSFGATVQFMIQMTSWIGAVRVVAVFGSAALAGNTIATRIIVFAILPSWGLSNAAATLVGQNLGAGKPDRAEQAVWRAGLYNMLFLGAVGLLFILFAESVVGIFTSDPAVKPIAVTALRLFSCGYISFGYGMVVSQAFNGAGDTFTPTMLNLICFWFCQIPLAYVLANYTPLRQKGVYVAVLVADSMLAVLGILAFRRGTWKKQVV
jgi:putative MATE family efflux protein